MHRILLVIFSIPTLVTPIIRPTFSSEVTDICSGFGFNWAAEIRCLREFAASCISHGNEDKSRGLRSLPGIQPDYSNLDGKYNGYPNGRNVPTTTTRRQFYGPYRPTPPPSPPVLQTCECDLADLSRNLSSQFERRLYEVKMGAEYECREQFDKLRDKLETDLSEYQRMTDADIREIKRKLQWMESPKSHHNGHEYAYIAKYESWYTAEEHCIGWGGHLASIHDSEENRVIASLIPEGHTAWIGLNDVQKEKVFVNTDRTKSKFRKWEKGQPDNGQHNENCVLIDSNGEWNDLLCLVTRPFVCKRTH